MFVGVSMGVLVGVVLVSGQGQYPVKDVLDVWGPDQGNWTVDGDCIIAKMAAEVKYFPTQSNATILTESVPKNATAIGECNPADNTTQELSLMWSIPDPDNSTLTLNRNVNIVFKKNVATAKYGVSRINAVIETRHYQKPNGTGPNATEVFTTEFIYLTTWDKKDDLEFKTPLNRSFLCADIGKVSMTAILREDPPSQDKKLDNATMTATKVQLDAFRSEDAKKKTPDQFQIPLDCAFHPSDVVPIIVGCALAGLVVLVLIAYLIGRRRSRARGYQSV